MATCSSWPPVTLVDKNRLAWARSARARAVWSLCTPTRLTRSAIQPSTGAANTDDFMAAVNIMQSPVFYGRPVTVLGQRN